MLSTEDIAKLIAAEEKVFTTKADFDELRKDFANTQTAVVTYAKQVNTNNQETIVHTSQIQRIEAWIKRVAAKVGIEYHA